MDSYLIVLSAWSNLLHPYSYVFKISSSPPDKVLASSGYPRHYLGAIFSSWSSWFSQISGWLISLQDFSVPWLLFCKSIICIRESTSKLFTQDNSRLIFMSSSSEFLSTLMSSFAWYNRDTSRTRWNFSRSIFWEFRRCWDWNSRNPKNFSLVNLTQYCKRIFAQPRESFCPHLLFQD